MRHERDELSFTTPGKGLLEFTPDVAGFVSESGISEGLLSIFCAHTSCSLLIQENADPDVQTDLEGYFDRIVPKNQSWFRHTTEGPDDMPAHIRTALTSVSLTIPVGGRRLMLGTWQGIYLFEHREHAHSRRVILDLIGE